MKYLLVVLTIHDIYTALRFPAASQGDCWELSPNHEKGCESRESLGWAQEETKAGSLCNPGKELRREKRDTEDTSRRKITVSCMVFPTVMDCIVAPTKIHVEAPGPLLPNVTAFGDRDL